MKKLNITETIARSKLNNPLKAINNWKESRRGNIEADIKVLFVRLNRLADKRTSKFDKEFHNKLLKKLNTLNPANSFFFSGN